jgi:hypothetical protein
MIPKMANEPKANLARRLRCTSLLFLTFGGALVACSGGDHVLGAPRDGGAGTSTTGGSSTTGSSTGTGIITPPDATPFDGPLPPAPCDTTPTADKDHDGYTQADGDCNDCDPAVNPGAFDVPGSKIDEDCSGAADDEIASCEDGLPSDGDAVSAAKALGLCRTAVAGATGKDRTWGLLSARYVFPDGTTKTLPPVIANECSPGGVPNDLSHGILHGFGSNVRPRQGVSLVALSSGVARAGKQPNPGLGGNETSPDGAAMCTRSALPPGFPVSAYDNCGDLPPDPNPEAYDGMALELVIRAPTNAKAFTFDFDFYTFEYPEYVCGVNDAFVALLDSKSPDVPMNHNVAFDSKKNVVSVNNGFLEVCEPYVYMGTKNGMPYQRPYECKLGIGELAGTGFDTGGGTAGSESKPHAATGWLRTRANILPGEEFTLRFAIWDLDDNVLDSTVLLDNMAWDAQPGSNETIRPPPPK